jgi:hypothetical protein
MNEEIFTSNVIDTIVTFVGIREYLVSEFLNPYILDRYNGLKRVVFFSSTEESDEDAEIYKKSKEILQRISQEVEEHRSDVKIELILLRNIWDIKTCLARLSTIKATKASVNITAGPSSFSVACLLWAIENGHFIEHSVETNNRLTGKVVVFRRINVVPYFKSIFALDNIDKEIISFLKEGSSISTKIRQYLRNIKHFELTLRTIENRVSKLNEDGIVKISKGRNNIIDLSDDFKKLS